MADDKPLSLFAFPDANSAKDWQAVNDGVMGGVSEGKFKITEQKTMEFFGTLSLENNGGFASVRSKPKLLNLKPGDSLIVKIRGDGREYLLNLYLNKAQMAFSYRAAVPTKKDEWTEVTLPLGKFIATSFGQVVQGAAPVDPNEVNAIGFMLADKKPGAFKLEVDSIKISRSEK
jgi:NADH dehydrogenase [ubiquinone] 1 alpha subcomplex assembly factor 1